MPVPEFARPPAASENGAPPASFLVAWEVDAEQGIGPVLLLARAAHCLQQLHVVNAGRQPVAGSELWQVKIVMTLMQHKFPLLLDGLPYIHLTACYWTLRWFLGHTAALSVWLMSQSSLLQSTSDIGTQACCCWYECSTTALQSWKQLLC